MKSTYSVSKAQNRFPHLLWEATKSGAIVITRHDETVAYLVARERMEAIVETMDVLSNPMAMKAIRDYEQGQTSLLPLDALDDEG
ncbi:MAG: type II toxin-antitoxin system Phd/YefM family antitoxin [Kiritimatiellia bacterium]|jgi:PHD/YefM family antitoxin component YafN of YafNO toxin-antitoxin module